VGNEERISKRLILFFIFMFVLTTCAIYGGKIISNNLAMSKYRLMIVLSGSMKPAINTGALVGVKQVNPGEIQVGNIITYQDLEKDDRLISHRVIDIIKKSGHKYFATKGDANASRDLWLVPEANLVGRVDFSLPYVGYLINLAQTKIGLLLIMMPFFIILLGELGMRSNMISKVKIIKKRIVNN
jgi:signal peptidase